MDFGILFTSGSKQKDSLQTKIERLAQKISKPSTVSADYFHRVSLSLDRMIDDSQSNNGR
jgi:hypothetical protein